ncbi:hypothetical protein [Gracilibacillus caseinilyticus]|nr:hypothetical protein [Gracilibacillus caseinilyticus]
MPIGQKAEEKQRNCPKAAPNRTKGRRKDEELSNRSAQSSILEDV